MMRLALLSSVAPALAFSGADNTWAVIAAGSSGYMNYRHQADACHAYQTLIKAGVSKEKIIVMMQDDVAHSSENPFPGKIFNKPGKDAVDVYAGCNIDYRGDVVTAKLFTSVITGDTAGVPAGGKVLKSTSGDRVFLNFVDHGGVGIVAFPNGPLLHASELSDALKQMQSKNMFSELLFYMEACESGSMFPDLTADGKIFAVTAANGKESSWGYYCGSDAVVDGKNLGTCLGDLFSISWMEDADLGSSTETIKTQVERVTTRTSKSHVCTFGDHSFESEPFGNFEFSRTAPAATPPGIKEDSFDVRDIPLEMAKFRYEHAETAEEKRKAFVELRRVLESRRSDDISFQSMLFRMCPSDLLGCQDNLRNGRSAMKNTHCHKELVGSIHEHCPRRFDRNAGGWNAYNMKYSQVLVNACENLDALGKGIVELKTIIEESCIEASAALSNSTEVLV